MVVVDQFNCKIWQVSINHVIVSDVAGEHLGDDGDDDEGQDRVLGDAGRDLLLPVSGPWWLPGPGGGGGPGQGRPQLDPGEVGQPQYCQQRQLQ